MLESSADEFEHATVVHQSKSTNKQLHVREGGIRTVYTRGSMCCHIEYQVSTPF